MDLNNVMMGTQKIVMVVAVSVKFKMDGLAQEIHLFKGVNVLKIRFNLRFRSKEQSIWEPEFSYQLVYHQFLHAFSKMDVLIVTNY